MAKICEVCNKTLGFLESMVKLYRTNAKCVVCGECRSNILEEISSLASIVSIDEREQAIVDFTALGQYNNGWNQ